MSNVMEASTSLKESQAFKDFLNVSRKVKMVGHKYIDLTIAYLWIRLSCWLATF